MATAEAAAAVPVRAPVWRLVYAGRDVTREVAGMVTAVTYTDAVHGEADELELVVEDAAGRWRGKWHPTQGDRIELFIGYRGEALLPCGVFQVDDVEANGPPATLTIRALAAGPVPAIRTRRSKGYEGQTLRQVAEAVARRHGLRVVGEIDGVRVERVTQNRETDLAFVHRLASRFGYVSAVRGDQLVFHRREALDKAAPTWAIGAADVVRYRLRHQTAGTYQACVATYTDPGTGETIRREVKADAVRTGDVYQLRTRAESPAQLEALARTKLRQLNARGIEGEITVQGRPQLVAGTNGRLTGFGVFDGVYQVRRSVHALVREGYTTTIEVRAV